jgi:hypothetical protein
LPWGRPSPFHTLLSVPSEHRQSSTESISEPMPPRYEDSTPTMWPSPNYERLSRLVNCLSLSDRDTSMLLEEISKLDHSETIPRTVKELKKAEDAVLASVMFKTIPVPISLPLSKDGSPMVEDNTVHLIHHDLIETTLRLINTPEHAPWLVWKAQQGRTFDGQSHDDQGDRAFVSELHTAGWWAREEAQLNNPNSRLLVVIINCDETPVTMTGRKVFPVYLSCGNLPRWFRQKASGWTLLGFLPVIRSVKAFKNSELVRSYRRQVKRWCMGELLRPVIDNINGMMVHIIQPDGSFSENHVMPRFPFLIADEPEVMHAMVGGFGSTSSLMPCSYCTITPSVTGLRSHAPPRDANTIRTFMCRQSQTCNMSKAEGKAISMHSDFNWMFFVPGYNPFENPADRMHQLDHGVFVLMKDLITDTLIRTYPTGSLRRFDSNWASLTRLPGGKIFKRGVSSLAFVACYENRIIAMGLPFVLRGVPHSSVSNDMSLPSRFLEDISMTYLCLRWLLGSEGYTLEKLEALSLMITRLQDQLDLLHEHVRGTPVNTGIKFHKLCHWVHFIKLFGCTSNWNTETFESAHRILKRWKASLSYSNSSSAGVKLMRQTTIRDVHADTLHDGTCDQLNGCIDSRSTRTRTSAAAPSVIGASGTHRGWGHGRLRGYANLADFLQLSTVVMDKLHEFESSVEFDDMAVEHLYDGYMQCLPHHAQSLAMLSTILNIDDIAASARQCPTDYQNTSHSDTRMRPVDDTYGHNDWTFVFPYSVNHLWFWRKILPMKGDIYARTGTDVVYAIRNNVGQTIEHVGRIRWIVSVGRNAQLVIIQRMRHIPYQHGPRLDDTDCVSRILSWFRTTGTVSDPLRRHCKMFRLMDNKDRSSYHVIHCGHNGHVLGHAMLQPDLENQSSNILASEHTLYFMIPYIIQ